MMSTIIIVAVLIGAAAIAGKVIHDKLSGVRDVINQIQQVTDDTMHTPKTLSGSEGVMLMRIQRDFPDFNVHVARSVVNGAISGYFAVLNERRNADRLNDCATDAFISEVDGYIATNSTKYESLRIHNTVISDYRKLRDEAVITWQSAIEYVPDGKSLMQYVYEIKYVYYLSADNSDGEGSAMICPYCGAPITTVGESKYCEYCGAGIEEASIERTWKVSAIKRTNR